MGRLGEFRVNDDLRCMRWPLGILCWLDMAGDGCRHRAVCWLHGKALNASVYVRMWRPAQRDSAGSR